MEVHEYLLKKYKSKEIQKKYFSFSDFLNDLINYFNDILDNKKKIYVTSVDNFKYYLEKYAMDINVDILNNLNILYQKSKQYHIDDLLFIGRILNDNNYKPNYSVYNEIDKLFFEDHSPACFDLVLRSKEICRFKYPDGQLLIDKILKYYSNAILKNYESYSFYHKIIFNMLSSYYANSSKKDDIINSLNNLKNDYLNFYKKGDRYEDILRLINSIICLRDGIDSKTRKRLMDSYGIKKNFSSNIEFAGNLNSYSSFSDLRDRRIITIDSKNSVTKDDALSIYRDGTDYVLTLYIADVGSFVPFSSLLYSHAKQRGASLYTNDKKFYNISMFPSESQNFFSLDCGVDKFVIAHEFRFSNDFTLRDLSIKRALIKVSNNYSYDEFNKLSRVYSPLNSDIINNLLDLSEGLIGNFKINIESKSMQVVSAFNLYLNSWMASYFDRNNYPFVYLNTSMFPSVDVLNYQLLSGFTSSYSTVSTGNIINYNKPYGYVTKPIRNFASYLNQGFEMANFIPGFLDDLGAFNDYWNEILPNVLYDLNRRIQLNKDYCDVVSRCKVKK